MNIQSDRGTRVLLKHLATWGIPLGMLTTFTMPAVANHIDTATASVTCNNYTICLEASALTPGQSYTITYQIIVTPTFGTATTISMSITFGAPSNGIASGCITQPLGPLTGTNSFSGSATLVGFNTIPITFSPTSLSCPTPTPTPTPPPSICSTLGPASGFAVLGLQGSIINLSSGPLRIHDNVGIGQSGNFNFSGGGEVCDTLDADPTAQVNISGGGTTITCGTVQMSMSSIQNAALAESNAAAALTPTQTFNQIVSSQTIVGNGGQNVILVTQLIHLSGGNLIISGKSLDTFIFNVTQGLQLDGGANIVLQGVPPSNVLFNFPGSGDQIQTSGNAQTAGIYLAPNRVIQINGGVHNSEFISGRSLSFQSNPSVTQPCPTQPCP